MNEYLCRCISCGEEFAGNRPSLVICSKCLEWREEVKQSMGGRLNPISSAAKRLESAIESAMLGRKYLQAANLVDELESQIVDDRIEADNRQLRKKAKSERWHSRQADRRSNDRSMAHGGGKHK